MRAYAVLLIGLMPAYASAQSAGQFRAEIHAGIDRVETDVEDTGLVYGVGIGYDIGIGPSLTAGIEVNADLTNAGRCVTGRIVPGDRLCSESAQDISVLARLSVRVSDRGRAYALLGYSSFQVDVDYTVNGQTASSDQTLEGVRAGIGYQHDINGRLYLKGEYRYTTYGDGESRNQGLIGLGISF